MENVQQQLSDLQKTDILVLIFFYADWCPHYNWLEEAIKEYEKRKVKYIQVNVEKEKALAESYNVGTVPTFVLMHKGHELWRKVSDLTVDELQLVLSEF